MNDAVSDNIPADVWAKYRQVMYRTPSTSKTLIGNHVLSSCPARVLDYGCGTAGTIGLGLLPNLVSVEGYDYRKDNPAARYHDLSEIEGRFDIIVFSHTIEHMWPDEAAEALAWMRPRCNVLLLATPNHVCTGFDFWKDLKHKRPYATPHTLAVMENVGFKIESVYFASMGMKRNLLPRLLPCMWKDEGLDCLFYEWVVVAR